MARPYGRLRASPHRGSPSPPLAPPPPPGATIALTVSGPGLRFLPQAPLAAAAGPLHISLANGGTLMHSIGVRSLPGPVTVTLTPAARPGGAVALDVTLPPGSYEVYCGVGDHAQRGMLLPLTVTPPVG